MTGDQPSGGRLESPRVATLELLEEQVSIGRRVVQGQTVRVTTTTTLREQQVEESLARETVEIERIPIGRVVEAIPEVREEGDTTIVPVIEEVVVLERRLVLKEEVRIRRVRTTEMHRETVQLRGQAAAITRSAPPGSMHAEAKLQPMQQQNLERDVMTEQTIVAVYDTPAHAELAVQDLLQASVPESAIHRHAQEGSYTGRSTEAVTRPAEVGFWASLFGGEPDHDTTVYDRSVQGGSNAVSVRVPEEHANTVQDILERHNPIDIDERAGSYGLVQTTRTALTDTPPRSAVAGETTPTGGMLEPSGREDGVIQLSEETLEVGKRVVNRGTTRIRRFVVETPVEQQVRLQDEKVMIERRAVTDGRPVTDAFRDKTIEMTESAEEAVISKTARVTEEVSLRKEATERTETVRDTVRREDVEITKDASNVRSTPVDTTTTKPSV